MSTLGLVSGLWASSVGREFASDCTTARIPPSEKTQPQVLIHPKGRAPVGSFMVKGQMKGERCGRSESAWRPLDAWCGGEGERAGLGVRLRLMRS